MQFFVHPATNTISDVAVLSVSAANSHNDCPSYKFRTFKKITIIFFNLLRLTYPMEQNPSREANLFSASQENPRRFITAISSAHHQSTPWARSIHSIRHIPLPGGPSQYYPPIYAWISQVASFPSGFHTKTLYTPLISPYALYATPILLFSIFITRRIYDEQYRSLSSSSCSYLHSLLPSTLLGSNIFLSTPFSNTLNLRSRCNVRNQVSHPYKTTGKIIVLYILIFIFLDSKLYDKIFCTE